MLKKKMYKTENLFDDFDTEFGTISIMRQDFLKINLLMRHTRKTIKSPISLKSDLRYDAEIGQSLYRSVTKI